MKTFNTLLTIALATLAAGVAQAQPSGAETPSSVVNFADLNLHSPAGVAQLHARIRAAANEVCGSASRHDLREGSRIRACKLQAMTRAIALVNTAALSSLASRPTER
jgi:UrcA family protein